MNNKHTLTEAVCGERPDTQRGSVLFCTLMAVP